MRTISASMFAGCSSLTTISISNNVTSIGASAFADCTGLTSFTIPNNVTSIGASAFAGCTSLTSITIPNSVTKISYGAFAECSALASIFIPNSVTTIERDVFACCDGLERIVVATDNAVYDSRDNSNAIIETSSNTLISGCKNTVIPNSVTAIGDYAFSLCFALTSITIPNSVTSIGDYAFYYCNALTTITVPNSVTSIGKLAFNYCETLTSVIIGNGVTAIGDAVFNNCGNLERIVVNAGNPVYDSRENCNAIIETSSNTLISGCKNTVIPNSVTIIGDGAFFGCSGLTSISIPNSVTKLGNEVFSYCIALERIAVETGNPIYDSRDNCNAIIETSSNTLISGCKNTVIPDDVTAIGYCAFRLCYGLTTITIPNSVTEISHAAFYACIGLKDFYCLAESVPTTGWEVFTNVELANVTLHVPATSLEAYRTEYPWSNFGQIVAIGEGDGIEELTSEEGNPALANPTYYDLNGRHTTKMQKGINILRGADGRVKKVVRRN